MALGNPQKERSLKPAGPVSESVSESRQAQHNVSAQHELWQKKDEQSGSERKQDFANHNGAKKPSPLLQDFRLSVDIDCALQKKLTQAQELSAFGKSSLQDVLGASLDLFIKDRMKVKFKQRSSPTRAPAAAQTRKTSKSTKATGRYIPSPIKREVAARDDFQCTFTSKSGHRCNEKQGLEYHHFQAFSLGGAHTPQNLTLLCRLHNQWDAEKTLGAQVMGRWRGVRT